MFSGMFLLQAVKAFKDPLDPGQLIWMGKQKPVRLRKHMQNIPAKRGGSAKILPGGFIVSLRELDVWTRGRFLTH